MNVHTASMLEADLGARMLAAERKAGHVARIPQDPRTSFGAAGGGKKKWQVAVLELVACLQDKSPQSRKSLAEALGCTKDTAALRAQEAIRQGLVRKVPAVGSCKNSPLFLDKYYHICYKFYLSMQS